MRITDKIFKESFLNYFSATIIIGGIYYFYYQFFVYTSDIPINDDYKAVLEFLNEFTTKQSFSEKIKLLFSQHNEHRIVYDRIWTLISYKIYGVANFNFLAFIGNLSYFILFLVIAIPFRKSNYFFLIPIAVLLFNFSFHENMTFAMATLSNNTGILFIVLSVYFAIKKTKHVYLSFVFYLFAVFTVGSGLFLTLVLPLIFLYKRQNKIAIAFILVAILSLTFYFMDYQKPPQTPSIIDTLLFFKFKSFLFFLAFLGNIFSFNLIFTNDVTDSLIFSSTIGGLLLLLYLYIIKNKYYKTNLFIFSIITFVFLAAMITSVSRAQFGLETAIASRYRLYSALLVIGFYYYFLNIFNLNKALKYTSVLLFTVIYFINISYKQIEYLDYRKNLNYLGVINYVSGNHTLLNGFEQDIYKTILKNANDLKTYSLPDKNEIDNYYPFSTVITNLNDITNTDLWFTNDIEQIFELEDSFLIFGKGFLDGQSSFTQKMYLEIENSVTKKKLTFETRKMKRYDMNPYFKKNDLDYGGFCCRISKEVLDENEYNIIISIKNSELFKKESTNKKIKKQ
jgi:hypothetical protein